MREHFDSDELLQEFGTSKIQRPGTYCKDNNCFHCGLLWTCMPMPILEKDKVSEIEPCGRDYALRNLHHGIDLERYAFHIEIYKERRGPSIQSK